MAENDGDGNVATKQKLTPDERRAAVQASRDERINAFFQGKQFEYVGPATLEGDSRYTDPSGNKGKSGHKIRQTSGEGAPAEHIVGPASLKRARDMGVIELDESVNLGRARIKKQAEPVDAEG